MAPKRSEKVVMKTKKKVVEESVKVSVVGTDQGSKETVKVAIEDKTQQSKAVFQVSTKGREVKAPLEERKKNAVEGRKVSTHHQLEGPPKKGRKKTAQGAEGGKEKKGSRKRKEGGYKRYVFKVMKQVHPELGISSNAMTVLNGFMNDMFERLASEAGRLSKYGGKMTLSSREIQGAVRLVLPGELGKHAIAEGTKAVTTFNMSNKAVGSRS